MNKPLGQSIPEVLTYGIGLSTLPHTEIDEYNGLRDAQEGNRCLTGQSEEYYQGYSGGYSQDEY